MTIDWSNDLVTSGLVILWEIIGLLPLLTWFILREIRRRLPEMMTELAADPKFVMALRQLAGKFGMPTGGKMNLNQMIAMGGAMLLQRFLGNIPAPPQAPPVEPPG